MIEDLLRSTGRGLTALLAIPALPALTAFAIAIRLTARPAETSLPRLVYGPMPILSFKYMARAMRSAGYRATTVVHELYGLHSVGDFDVVPLWGDQPRSPLRLLSRALGGDYFVFAWTLARFDVFHSFFDGGFLRRTPLRYMEAQLLHLAGKRLIVMPYGSDVAAVSRIQSSAWREALVQSYPDLPAREPEIDKSIAYYSQHADYVVACVIHAETLSRWDLLTTHYYPIDTSEWVPSPPSILPDGNRPVVVVHAPNHRAIKGTPFLIDACEQLRREGLPVELRLLEGIPNQQLHSVMASADILAEQFVLGYALTAMEGMSLGKPVMSNLTDDRYYAVHRQRTGLGDCPIVSVSPPELVGALRTLVIDAERRNSLGVAGRQYVERYHSLPAMARLWSAIYRRVWYGSAEDPAASLPNGPFS